VCVIHAYLAMHERTSCHLRSGKFVPNWERLPRNMTMSIWHSGRVYFPGETTPPQPSYSGTFRPTFSLPLSDLLRGVSPLGNWGKAPSPLQLYGRQSQEIWMPHGGLYHTANATWAEPNFSAWRLFFFFPLLKL
jgi:hypothetical protein